jgi:hypothetical protein
VIACREGRWVRSGGVLRFSCEAAWSDALVGSQCTVRWEWSIGTYASKAVSR